MWICTHTVERGEKVGVLIWRIFPSIHLLRPENTTSPGQCVWPTQPGHIHKVAAKLTSKNQTTSVIVTEKEDLLIQVPTKY